MGVSDRADDTEGEVLLSGGRANAGRVLRIGDEVARPSHPQTPTVNAFLRHLRAQGLRFVPKPLGCDDKGRQRLGFIEGTVPKPPYPEWALSDRLLVDVAARQRQLHAAAASFVAPAGAVWATSAGDYFPADADGPLVCHNDLGMSNIVVNRVTSSVAGIVDFDYCRPVDRLFDIAVAARHWVPFGELDVAPGLEPNRVHRFGVFTDAHGLTASDRGRVVDLAVAFLERARLNVRNLAEAGNVGFQRLIDNDYEAVNEATVRWLVENRRRLIGDG